MKTPNDIRLAIDNTHERAPWEDEISVADDPVTSVINEMNQNHAVVLVGRKALIIREAVSDRGTPDIQFLSVSDFRSYYANKLVTIKSGNETKELSVAALWLKHPHRRTYEGVTFAPAGNAAEGFYNLWRGFAVAPNSTASCDKFLDHVRDVICDGNEEFHRYLLGLLANMVQEPDNKPGVAVALRGDKGVGKTAFAEYIGKMLGQHYVKITRSKHLTGHFNAHMENILLAFVDEGYWAGDKAAEGSLKDLITSDEHLIERKGVDPIAIRNLVRVIFATNHDWVVPASADERRFFVLDVPNHVKQDHGYFAEYYSEMKSGGPGALLHHLRNLDINGINLRTPPSTKALIDQKLMSMSTAESWWFQCLKDAKIGYQQWPTTVPRSQVFDAYLAFAERTKDRHPSTDEEIGKNLHRWVPGLKSTRPHGQEGSRVRCYNFPSIDDARAAFEKRMGTVFGWDD